ncbi:MAG: DNA mismatch repair endonuclease MutL [Spirochaetes bacterium]|nr:MAG: DNA mismatch repair endonuclease MutL [Spirochaetota bacterium]
MSPKIHQLSSDVVAKIAAGEVIERPASVVKELVENSIDAKATDIEVHLFDGGKKIIEVVDNGEGIEPQEIEIALKRHATSKIKSVEELWELSSLGFRGEALPSIASVSIMEISSRVKENISGIYLKVEGGKIKEKHEIGMPCGTKVKVEELFFNLPARKKFLKSTSTELLHITDNVNFFALGFPNISFSLFHNGKLLLRALKSEEVGARVREIFGKTLFEGLVPIKRDYNMLKLSGYISRPEITRSSSKNILFFVNRRIVKDKMLLSSVIQPYRHFLSKDKYPISILYIDIDPHLVDVNVHPQKAEVRFREPNMIFRLIAQSIKEELMQSSWVKEEINFPTQRTVEQIREKSSFFASSFFDKNVAPQKKMEIAFPKKGFYQSLKIIGSLANTYILCELDEDLILVDQHAAHERVMFEKLKKQYENKGIIRQALVVSYPLELSLKERLFVEENMEALIKFGFLIEPFGGNHFIVKEIPSFLAGKDWESLFKDLLEEIISKGVSKIIGDVKEKMLITMACHNAIRAKDSLNRIEIEALFKELDSIPFSGNCPHGRPIYIRISNDSVKKMFKRE